MKPRDLLFVWLLDAVTFTMLPCKPGHDCWAKWILVLIIGFVGGFFVGSRKRK